MKLCYRLLYQSLHLMRSEICGKKLNCCENHQFDIIQFQVSFLPSLRDLNLIYNQTFGEISLWKFCGLCNDHTFFTRKSALGLSTNQVYRSICFVQIIDSMQWMQPLLLLCLYLTFLYCFLQYNRKNESPLAIAFLVPQEALKRVLHGKFTHAMHMHHEILTV